ncbi:MAG TPA: hypothetical protein PLE19_23650 [Planctomycetota bacterium]|nr:hypothetical protein [Planctomycetota bacterium]HRR82666.1 hypothetical protein [Planctomycetota bacterium]HRT96763.1 hypothetical protein [Planctomycetota bacterium]
MARRASTSERARKYRQEGHDNALLFALELGLGQDYRNDPQAKKDVIDPSGDAHSVKSGRRKWQIFLYSRSRFLADDGFMALNGIGTLLIHCIDAFPPSYDEYKRNPAAAKERLQTPMRELRDRFQRKALLRAFLMKAIFNGGEVNYLTVFDGTAFHVFLNKEVVQVMGERFEVVNSKALRRGEFADQKVLFRYKGKNVGELEMRNDSPIHYQEVRFNMIVKPAMELLLDAIPAVCSLPTSEVVVVHGNAAKRFGRWSL